MKQDNGNHAATPGPWDYIEMLSRAEYTKTGTPTFEAIECQHALCERDRLKAINAELVEALDTLLGETIKVLTKHFAQPRHDMIEDVPSIAKARDALAKAREQED